MTMLAPAPTGDDKQAEAATPPSPGCSSGGGSGRDEREGKRCPARSSRAALFGLLRCRRLWAAGALLALLATGLALAGPHLRAWYHFRAAQKATARYHNRQAIHHLQACLRVWPADADVLLLAARAARRARAYEEAERLLEQYQQARLGLAIVLLQSKTFSEAAEHLEQLLRRQPDNPRMQVGLAQCRHALAGPDEAVRLVDRVLEQRPHYAPALALRGQLALESGE